MPELRKTLKPLWMTADGETVQLYQGHVLDVLKRLPAKSIHCTITSPPYYGLRDYGTGTWEGGDPTCDHSPERRGGRFATPVSAKQKSNTGSGTISNFNCPCGAKRIDHQLGSEALPDCGQLLEVEPGLFRRSNCAERCWDSACHVCRMVLVFREVRRVLRDDGCLFLNYGDTYAGGGKGPGGTDKQRSNPGANIGPSPKIDLPAGNLCMIPARVALALQSDGWILRSDIPWVKRSAMPECLDGCTQVFIRQGGWVSRTTLQRVFDMPEKPEILGPDGWTKIKAMWTTEKESVTFTAGKVERVICSADHRFPVSSDRRRKAVRLEPVKNIRHQGYADYLLYSPIDVHLQPTITTWGGSTLSYGFGYVIGLYAAEGSQEGSSYRMKWTLHLNEDEIESKFRKGAAELGLSVTRTNEKSTKCKSLFIVSGWLQRAIQTFVLGRIAKNKKLNIEMLLNVPREFRQGLLDGYIDGDGSDRLGGGWSAASASRQLRDDVSTLASSLGIITSKGWSRRTLKGYGEFECHNIWTPYMTKRKKKSGSHNYYQVPPRSLKRDAGTRTMYDLETESGTFIIGDGLITHNSVRNRPAKALEYVFLLVKRMGYYYYDQEAVKKAGAEPDRQRSDRIGGKNGASVRHGEQGMMEGATTARNFRNADLWFESVDAPHGLCGVGEELVGLDVTSSGYPGAHFACVDEETEALTKQGWAKQDQLSDGQEIACYDPIKDRLVWSPASFHRYQHYGEMVSVDKRDSSQLLTPDHKCLVTTRKLKGRIKSKPAGELSHSDKFLMTAEMDEPPEMSIGVEMAALVGWYASEGYRVKGGYYKVGICQSVTANPDKVKEILRVIVSLTTGYRQYWQKSDRYDGVMRQDTHFKIGGRVGINLVKLCPNKRITWELTRLPKPELEALLDAFIAGDGHTRPDDGRTCIIQKHRSAIEPLQVIAIKLGYRAILSQRKTDGMFVLYLTKGRWLDVRGSNGTWNVKIVDHSGIVWCPNTPTGFWLARRNGKPFITGNTFPPKLIEPMIKAGTSEHGCCADCGSPWVRMVEPDADTAEALEAARNGQDWYARAWDNSDKRRTAKSGDKADGGYVSRYETIGWRPSCVCGAPPDLRPDDLELIYSPTIPEGEREDPTLLTGRAGMNRARIEGEGTQPMTRFEQRAYAEQLKRSPHREEMEAEAGEAFAHYVRTDRSGARPIRPKLLEQWIARGWLKLIEVPVWEPPPVKPCMVLDIFMGSGTTAAVAIQLGRHAVGIELSEDYLLRHQVKRVKEALLSVPHGDRLLPEEPKKVQTWKPKAVTR